MQSERNGTYRGLRKNRCPRSIVCRNNADSAQPKKQSGKKRCPCRQQPVGSYTAVEYSLTDESFEDVYFQDEKPDFEPPIHMIGTPFQIEVWNILHEIPYGTTTTYNEIAKKIAENRGLERMSAQAVGTAVGKNNINLIVPCHRVVGTNNSLAGYAGGIDKKIRFLKLEGGYKEKYFIPKHSTAP